MTCRRDVSHGSAAAGAVGDPVEPMNPLRHPAMADAAAGAGADCAPSCRRALREATHGARVRLNQHPLLACLFRPGYDVAAYLRVLAAYFHFYRAVEPAIVAFIDGAALDFDYAARRKAPWLMSDLHMLGVDPEGPVWRPPRPPAALEIPSAAHLVGVLYAIEDATLDGRAIARHVGANLGLATNSGGRFFNGYGAHTDARWAGFEQFMEALCPDADSRAQAARSARATLAAFEGWLDDYAALAR